MDLLRTVAGPSAANTLVSPHSASIALAMTYAGTTGETKDALAKALHFTQPEGTTHAAFDATDLALASRQHTAASPDAGAVELSSANSLWSPPGKQWDSSYLDTLARSYGAGVNLVDFADSVAAARAIDGWVSDRTHARIPELLTPAQVAGASWVLTNAIYLKADWASRFTKEATQDQPFHAASGATVTVPTMVQSSTLRAVHRDDYDAVELPYDGGQLAMILVAPTSGTFASFTSGLRGRDLLALPLESTLVDLSMPKFETRTKGSLSGALGALGMPLSGAFPGGASQIDVIQEAWLAADERGTEAAAATAVVGFDSSAPLDPPQPLEIHLDRPFVYAVVDKPSGAILFLGEMLDPSAK